MEVVKVPHMNAGDGEKSYALNSLLQRKAQSMGKLVRQEAIRKVVNFIPSATSLAISDLGCSSGPNTLILIKELITSIYDIRRESGNQLPIDIQVFLNDLPGNDFNTIFKSLPSFHQQLKNEKEGGDFGGCFVNAVPGSFYGRLFLPQSLHFVHSSYSLQLLSQVPKGIGRSNKGNIHLASSSPASVIKAYYEQFQSDFSSFLGHRAEELVTGGSMVFTLLGRKSKDPTSKEGSSYVWELLSLALNQMVDEGLIEEEKLHLFNIPQYTPSATEVEIQVNKEGSFSINSLQVLEIDMVAVIGESSRDEAPVRFANFIRAVVEPMMVVQFGEALMDEIFARFTKIIAYRMAKETNSGVHITVSLTKLV